MGNVDYRKKYLELRSVLNNVVDRAFRAGYQQGAKDAQMDSMAQQVDQQNQMLAQMSGGVANDPDQMIQGDDGSMPPDQQADQFMDGAADAHEQAGSSELEQGISDLEAELGKSERNEQNVGNLLAAINRSMKKMNEARELKKSAAAIKKLKQANKKIQKTSLGYKHNLSKTHKKAVSGQQKIVTDILKKWESEATDATADILKAVTGEGKAE